MAEYIDVAKARELAGLRLVVPNLPGPWAEGAKGLFFAAGIPYARVLQRPGEANEELVAWTGESNAPQAIYEDEKPRTGWTEMILLAERLAPERRLLPKDPEARALVFGLGFALCGEGGFGWQRRLMSFREVLGIPEDVLPASHPVRQSVAKMARRYGYTEAAAAAAPARTAAILRGLSDRLEAQGRRESRYLVGSALTAIDIYWATFAAMLSPLPEEQCPMPDIVRSQYRVDDPQVLEAASPRLLEHRIFVYEQHLELPVDL